MAGVKVHRFDALLRASTSIVWSRNADGEFNEVQPSWQDYTGQAWDEYQGSRWVRCLHPEDRETIVADWTRAVASGSPYFSQGRIWSVKHNAYRTFQSRAIPVKNKGGGVQVWLGAVTDVQDTIEIKTLLESARTDLANSLRALRLSEARSRAQANELVASEQRFRALINATSFAVFRMNQDWSEMQQMDDLGFINETEPRGANWLVEKHVHPEDQARVSREIQRAIAAKSPFDAEHRVVRADGNITWIHSRAIPILAETGELREWFGAATDITQRKQQEEYIKLLLCEVNHRSKNLLAVVQAIARYSADQNPLNFMDRFEQRLAALSLSHDLLTRNEWMGADLAELIRAQLAHFDDLIDARITIRGHPVHVCNPWAAQSIGMALHELATNASKYGALTDHNGKVTIEWDVLEDGHDPSFVMSWRENDGPQVVKPANSGFGSTVLGPMVEQALNGKVQLAYPAKGLTWQLRCPLGAIVRAAAL